MGKKASQVLSKSCKLCMGSLIYGLFISTSQFIDFYQLHPHPEFTGKTHTNPHWPHFFCLTTSIQPPGLDGNTGWTNQKGKMWQDKIWWARRALIKPDSPQSQRISFWSDIIWITKHLSEAMSTLMPFHFKMHNLCCIFIQRPHSREI